MKEVYKRIKDLRIARNMTQAELGMKAGYKSGKVMISQIERGMIDLPTDRIVVIADALGVTPSYLIGVEDGKESQLLKDYILDMFLELNADGRKKAQEYLELLASNAMFKREK